MGFRMMKYGMMRLGGGVELRLRHTGTSSQSDVPVLATMLINRILITLILTRSSRRQATTAWDRGLHGA